MTETINRLAGEEEFRAKEINDLTSLPIASVPPLTQMLRNVPAGTRHQREFKLLASKVTQFERQLSGEVLDGAVAALLERIKPEDHTTSSLQPSLRIKLKDVGFIKDPRILEGVRKARVFLGLEQETADQAQNLPAGSGAVGMPQAASDSNNSETHAAETGGQQGSTALWPVWSVMAVAAMGLLWLLLKNRKERPSA